MKIAAMGMAPAFNPTRGKIIALVLMTNGAS
jgi:hypothetical protein